MGRAGGQTRLGGTIPRPAVRASALAVVLVVSGVAVLVAGFGTKALAIVAGVALLALGLTVAILAGYAGLLRGRLLREIVHLTGPGLIALLPPRRALTALLAEAYGATPENVRHVVRGVLGGEGDSPDDDRSVSNRTTIHYLLKDEVPGVYSLTSTVEYRFPTPIHDDRVVIFATCDSRLKDVIGAGATCQVFDYFFTSDESLFQDTVDRTFGTVGIGVEYRDIEGVQHRVDVAELNSNPVPVEEWHDYLAFFEDAATDPERVPEKFLDTLRIYEFNLSELQRPDAPLATIDQVSLRTLSMQSTEDPHCFWSASWPCYVNRITFDLSGFGQHEGGLEYRLVPFLLRAEGFPTDWMTVRADLTVDVGTWMMPGHGVALLWRPRGEMAD